MNTTPCRLYIFTGKGGVGKSTLSRAFARHLTSIGYDAIYLTFRGQSIGAFSQENLERTTDGLKEVFLDLEDSARAYIEKRVSSKLIANWIVKTPFFRALINMVPGFNYLIFLGKILEMNKANPNRVIVLDAPASGHALTMVESTSNFQQIFESGVIFEDTGKMLALLNDPAYTKIHVVSLPSLMSWQEALELRAGLKALTPVEVPITVNNCLYPLIAEDINELPKAIAEKVQNEEKLVKENQAQMHCVLPHSLAKDSRSIELELVGSLSKLI